MVQKVAVLAVVLLSLTLVSALELSPQTIGEDLQIYQECNNCTYCNFTRVIYDGDNIFTNVEAVQDGTYYYFDILGPNITSKDTLTYCYDCGNTAEKDTGCIDIPLTYNGHHLTTETSILYIAMTAFLLFIFIILLMALKSLPKDVRNSEGFVLDVSKLAYLRFIFMGLAWIVLTSIVFIAANISVAYLDTGLMGSALFLIYRLMFISNFVILPLCLVKMIQRIAMSKEMLGLIERGVQFQ